MPSIRQDSRRRNLLGNVAAAIGMMALLALAELGLRGLGVPRQGRLFFESHGLVQFSPHAALRYFSPHARWVPEAHSEPFEHPKPHGTLRVVCLGGSTMAGYPFVYNGTLPSLIDDRLSQLFPERRVEVLNLAVSALGSYAVFDICKAVLPFDPDIVVVYCGHNEFYGALGIGSSQTIHAPRPIVLLHLGMQDLSLYRLLWQAWGYIRRPVASEAPGPTLMARMVDTRCIPHGGLEYRRGMDAFAANIRDIARRCRGAGTAKLVLCEVVSNIRDQPPFEACRDIPSDTLGYGPPSALAPKSPPRATSAGELFAEARYAERSGDTPRAARLYRLARNADGLRFRAASDVNDSLRAIARREGACLVPLVGAFDSSSLFAAPGYDLFIDHLHPNFEGYLLMAETIVNTLRDESLITTPHSWPWGRELDRAAYRERSMVTQLEHALAYDKIDRLMSHWPFTEEQARPVYSFDDSILSLAQRYHDEQLSWSSIHLSCSAYFMRRKQYAAARREAAAVLKQASGFWPAWLKIGDAYLAESRPLEAAEAYDKARALGGPQGESFAKIGSALLGAGRYEAAARQMEAALAQKTLNEKDTARAMYILGLALASAGDKAGAQAIVRELEKTAEHQDLSTRLIRFIAGNEDE